jgi:hypothetical protein
MPSHNLTLTSEEIVLLEETLYDRSTVLSAIGSQLIYAGKKDQAVRLDKRSRALEELARKVSLPLDKEYIANYNNLGRDGE